MAGGFLRRRRPRAAARREAWTCLLGLLGTGLVACGGGPERVRLEPVGGALVEELRVRLEREPDRAGSGLAWSLALTNAGPRELRDLVLDLGGGWSTPVAALGVFYVAATAISAAPAGASDSRISRGGGLSS